MNILPQMIFMNGAEAVLEIINGKATITQLFKPKGHLTSFVEYMLEMKISNLDYFCKRGLRWKGMLNSMQMVGSAYPFYYNNM